ncbi:MAG: hypothetical protein ACOVLC_06150 [Flavobacterium sp.]
MKIKIKQNIDGLSALNKLCFIALSCQALTAESKHLLSIIQDVDKIVKSPLERAIENNNLSDSKKKYTFTLKYHEAYAVHLIIIEMMCQFTNPLTILKLNQIKDFLNQKMT